MTKLRQGAFVLPDFYAITAPLSADGSDISLIQQPGCREWLGAFQRLLDSGIEMVQLRAKELRHGQLRSLAEHCQDLVSRQGVRLVLNGPAELAMELGVSGVHLPSKALMGLKARPVGSNLLVGASCHCAQELAQAEIIGADFACLSPVRPIEGYGDRKALGFDGFAELARECAIPVYALGGLRREDLARVRDSNGCGVAGISAFWLSNAVRKNITSSRKRE